MTKDALEKIIESVVDWSRAYQHALDQGPESEAVACESELKIAKAELLAALAPEPNQPEEGPVIKILCKEQPFHEIWLNDLVVLSVIKFEGNIDITGHWRKVEP